MNVRKHQSLFVLINHKAPAANIVAKFKRVKRERVYEYTLKSILSREYVRVNL